MDISTVVKALVGPIVAALRWLWGWLWGWLRGWLARRLFLRTYRRAQEISAKRRRLGAIWEACGSHFEYSDYLAQFTDPEPRTSRIALRSVSEDIDVLALVFEAESASARFQERIEVFHVGRKPIVWTMTNVPYQDYLGFHERSGPRFSWESCRIIVTRLKLKSGEEARPFETIAADLTHSWFLNSKWKHRWGRFWNLDAVEWAKRRLAEYWRWGFGMPSTRQYGPNGLEVGAGRRLAIVFTRPIAWLLSRDSVVTIQFWMAIWSGLYVLNDESELHWRWSNPAGRPEDLPDTSSER